MRHDPKKRAGKFALGGFEPTRTEQAHKKQCDMNYILREYAATGVIKHAHENRGSYDDVSSVDFQEAMNLVADTKSMFEALPGLVRKEFGNDVMQFLNFARNPENGVKMQEMGITPGIDGVDAHGQLIEGMQELVAAFNKAGEPTALDGADASAESGGSSGTVA